MSAHELYTLLPLITLSSVILALMMVIAFWRNLKVTCGFTATGLILTIYVLVTSDTATPVMVTPLILIDSYASIFSILIIFASLVVTLISYNYLEKNNPDNSTPEYGNLENNYHPASKEAKQEEFFLLLLLSTLGGMITVCSSHVASFILGLELLSISIYALISYPARGTATLEAALKYLILSGVASAFILFGAALIYAAFGSLAFTDLADSLSGSTGPPNLLAMGGSAMFVAGMGFKLSLVPFHMWTPDVYEGAPAPVAGFVATVSKGAIFLLLLRFFVMTEAYQYEPIVIILSSLAIASMLAGNILALLQNSLKRMLAYSSIAHLGYLMVAFIAGGVLGGRPLAIEAASYFLFAYFVTTLGAFSVITLLSLGSGTRDNDQLEQYRGLFWRRPALATAFTAMMLSLAGIPLTMGFVGKFYLFAAGVQGSLWLLIGALVVGSGISIFYYLRVILVMSSQSEHLETQVHTPFLGSWIIAILTLVLVVFGIYPTPVINVVNQMISTLT